MASDREPTKAEEAVSAILKAIRDDGRKAYLMGPGTNSWELLTAAHAESIGVGVEEFRKDFWGQCRPERIRVVEDA